MMLSRHQVPVRQISNRLEMHSKSCHACFTAAVLHACTDKSVAAKKRNQHASTLLCRHLKNEADEEYAKETDITKVFHDYKDRQMQLLY